MTKDNLKNSLTDIHAHLAGLEAEARKLQNQNLADVVKSAMGKIQQLSEHPDLEHVTEGEQTEKLPFDISNQSANDAPLTTGVVQPDVSGSDFPAQQDGAGQQVFVPPRT